MDLSSLLNTQYGFHAAAVVGVVVCAILVFVFSFRSPQEPEFDKLSDDRKAGGKKRKVKDKKSQANGHATSVSDSKKSDVKVSGKKDKDVDKSPLKDSKKQQQENKKSPVKAKGENEKEKTKARGKENVLSKNKKNIEPVEHDDDDGEWEQAVSRKDKRSKKVALKEILPQKNEKKKSKKAAAVSEEEEVVDTEKLIADLEAAGINAEIAIEPVVEPVPAPVVHEAPAAGGKKKKKKAPDVPTSAGPAGDAPKPQRQPAPVKEEKPVPAPVKEEKVVAPVVESPPVSDPVSNIAFDELGDTWKEAKAPKKSQKKKTRMD